MSNDWFYRLPGASEELGPLPFDELRRLGAAGDLPRNALIRMGDGAWKVSGSVDVLWEADPTVAHLDSLEEVTSLDDLGISLVDETPASPPKSDEPVESVATVETPVDPAPASDPEMFTSLDDLGLNIVDETPADDSPGSLDDLGLNLVSEADSPPVRMQRVVSRVLADDEWHDPDAFFIEHAGEAKPRENDESRLDELQDLLDTTPTDLDEEDDEGATIPRRPSTPAKPTPKKPAPQGQYFVKVDGSPHGPIDFPTLRKWAEEGRVIEEDEIQLPGADIWIPASALAALFEGIAPEGAAASKPAPPKPAPAKPEPPSAAVPKPETPLPPIDPDPEPEPPSAPEPSLPPPGAPVAAAPAPPPPTPAFTPPKPVTPPKPAAKPTKPKKVKGASGGGIGDLLGSLTGGAGPVAIGILALVGLYFGWQYMPSFGSDGDADTYRTLIAHYQKSLELRAAGGTGWDGFANAAISDVDAITEKLVKTASSKEPEKQRMLWAARDHLKSILSNPGAATDSEDDVRFRGYMTFVRQVVAKDDPEVPPVPQPAAGGDGGGS